MKRHGIPSVAGALLLAVSGCRNSTNTPEKPANAASAQVATPAPAAPLDAPASAPPGAAQHAAEAPYPGQDPNVGKWVESSAYKFKVSAVRRCADPQPSEGMPVDRPLRFGVSVEVFSKYDQLFVSPRDVRLERGGVILKSERGVKPGPECGPLLEPTRVNHDRSTRGVVIFQVADEAFVREGVVAFQPTRWGTAPRVEIKLAEAKLAPGTRATPGAQAKIP